jgi:hypothetical protein
VTATRACGALVVLLLSLPIARLPSAFSIDYNEGVNAYHAADAMAGRPLYPPDLRAINYPPLSFYAVGAIGALVGDHTIAGRAVALAALVAAAACVGSIVALLGTPRDAAAVAALTAVGTVAALAPGYVAMNDPELLAHALALLALAIHLRHRAHPTVAPLGAVAGLLAASLLMKHTLLPVPIAIGWDLWRRSRRAFAVWAGALAGLLVVAAASTEIATDGRFLADVIIPRELELEHWVGLAGSTLLRLAPLVVVAAPVVLRAREGRGIVRVYFCASLAAGLVFAAGAGTDVNFFFDLFLATAIAVGLSLADFARNGRSASPGWALGLTLLFFVVAVPVRVLTPARYRALAERAAASRADVAFVAAEPGEALCETSLLCYWALKPFAFDPYLVSEKILGGHLPESAVIETVASGRFRVIQLDHPVPPEIATSGSVSGPIRRRGRFTERTLATIAGHYRLARQSANGAFYVSIK